MAIYVIPALLALVLLFSLAARYWRIALALRAFFHWIAFPLAVLGEQAAKAKEAFRLGLEKTLPPVSPPRGQGDAEPSWRGKEVILRVILLVISVCIFGGDLPFAQLRNSFLLQVEQTTHIPLPLDVLGAVLWLAVPALWAEALFDVAERVPSSTKLLPPIKSKLVRALVFLLTLAFLALSIFNTGLFYFYGQYPISVGPLSNEVKQLGVYIVAAFGLLIAAVSGLALRAFVLGVHGLASAVLGLLYCLASICSLPCTLLATWVRGIGDMLSVVQPFRPFQSESIAPDASLLREALEPARKTVVEAHPPKESDVMNSKRNIVLTVFGNPMLELLGETLDFLKKLGGLERVLAIGALDMYEPLPRNLRLPELPGIKSITPASEEVRRAQEGGEGIEDTFESLARLMVGKIKEAFVQARCPVGTVLIYADVLLAPNLAGAITILRNSIPMAKIVVVTSLPIGNRRDVHVQEACDRLLALQQNGKLEAVFIADPNSPFAKKRGQAQQARYIALCLADLMVGHYHFSQNPPLALFAEWLGNIAPMFSFSFATAHIAPAKTMWTWWNALRRWFPMLPSWGFGEVADTITQARLMNDVLLSTYDARGMDMPVDVGQHFFIVYTIPLGPRNSRFRGCADQVRMQLARKFPIGGGLIVGGNGIPDFTLGRGFFCTAIGIYPLAKVPLLLTEVKAPDMSAGEKLQ